LNVVTFLYFVPSRLAPSSPTQSAPTFGDIALLRETLDPTRAPRVVMELAPARVFIEEDWTRPVWLSHALTVCGLDCETSPSAAATPNTRETPPPENQQASEKPQKNHEIEKTQTAAASMTPASTSPLPCFVAGPVMRDSKLSRLLQQHRAFFGEITLEQQTQRVLSRYLVYLPPVDNFERAQAQLAALQARGQDAWIFREGEMRGAISLGVFHDATRAERARAAFQAQGLAAQVMPRYREKAQWFVKMLQPVGAGYAERLAQALRRLAPDLQFSSCKQTLHGK